jgi:hypothetical protein
MLINLACLKGKTFQEWQECRIYCTDEVTATQAKDGQDPRDVHTLDLRSHVKFGMATATFAGGVLAIYQRIKDPTGQTLLTFAVENLGSAVWKIGTTLFQ